MDLSTRSRTGCRQCRKVSRKCDEGRPLCSRCHRLGMECDYSRLLSWKPKHAKDQARIPLSLRQARTARSKVCTPTNPSCKAAGGIESSSVSRDNFPTVSGKQLTPSQPESDAIEENVTKNSKSKLVSSFPITPSERLPTSSLVRAIGEILGWSSPGRNSLLVELVPLCLRYPAINDAVVALVAAHKESSSAATLVRFERALISVKGLINSPVPSDDFFKVLMAAALSITQISMKLGQPWTAQLSNILDFTLQQWNTESDSSSKLSAIATLEALGGLDMDAWIICRRTAPLHIWARFCSGRDGIEGITGLPRSLLDLIARVSLREDVENELRQWSPPKGCDRIQTDIALCYRLTALLYLNGDIHTLHDADSLIWDLMHYVQRFSGLDSFNQRALLWPVYVSLLACFLAYLHIARSSCSILLFQR